MATVIARSFARMASKLDDAFNATISSLYAQFEAYFSVGSFCGGKPRYCPPLSSPSPFTQLPICRLKKEDVAGVLLIDQNGLCIASTSSSPHPPPHHRLPIQVQSCLSDINILVDRIMFSCPTPSQVSQPLVHTRPHSCRSWGS